MKIEVMPGADISAKAVLGSALERAIDGELVEVAIIGFDKEGAAALTYSTMKSSAFIGRAGAFDAMVSRILLSR